jgi:hypothetical protein
MEKRIRRSKGVHDFSFLPRLLFLALFFSAGVVLGQVFAGKVPDGTCDELSRYLTDFLSLSGNSDRTAETFLSALVIYFRYPLLAFLLGFASAGIVLLPVLSAAYGFFLSFSVCCFTAAFGSGGVLLALSVFGFRCLVTMPCYFLLAVPSFENAAGLAAASFGHGRRTLSAPRYGSAWWLRLCLAVAVLLSGAVAELFLSPFLLHLAMARVNL